MLHHDGVQFWTGAFPGRDLEGVVNRCAVGEAVGEEGGMVVGCCVVGQGLVGSRILGDEGGELFAGGLGEGGDEGGESGGWWWW